MVNCKMKKNTLYFIINVTQMRVMNIYTSLSLAKKEFKRLKSFASDTIFIARELR